MIRSFLTAILSLISIVSIAQQDTTLIFSRPGYDKDPVRSKWKATVAQKDSVWIVSLHDRKKLLREEITYSDKKLEVRKGLFTAYFDDGSVKEQGTYDKGYKNGEWTSYFPNKQIMERANYSYGLLHGPYKAYWDNGAIKKEGIYTLRKKMANWRMFYKNGKPALNENYDDRGKLIDGTYLDENGNQKDILAIIQAPSYAGGMTAFYQYLMRTLKYPVEAAKNKIEGSVRLEFTVTTEGKVEEIKVVSSPDDDLSAEAIRVLQLSSGWIAGKELGETVNMKYTLPIKFGIK